MNLLGCSLTKEFPFLAASTDGLIEEIGIVEIKYSLSCASLAPEESILAERMTFCYQRSYHDS